MGYNKKAPMVVDIGVPKAEFDAYKADNALQLDAKMDKFGGLIEGSLDMGSNGIILGPFRIIANVTQGSLDFELI